MGRGWVVGLLVRGLLVACRLVGLAGALGGWGLGGCCVVVACTSHVVGSGESGLVVD